MRALKLSFDDDAVRTYVDDSEGRQDFGFRCHVRNCQHFYIDKEEIDGCSLVIHRPVCRVAGVGGASIFDVERIWKGCPIGLWKQPGMERKEKGSRNDIENLLDGHGNDRPGLHQDIDDSVVGDD